MRIDADDRAAHDASAAEGGIDRVPLLPLLRRKILIERTEVQIVEGFLLRFGRFRFFFRCGHVVLSIGLYRFCDCRFFDLRFQYWLFCGGRFFGLCGFSGCMVSSCSTSGSAFFLGICSSSCKNYFLAKKRCVPFSCRIAKMTGLVYENASGRMLSGSRTMIFSSCRISRSGGGSLPDTMTNCLKLGSPSEKRSRVCLSTAKKLLRLCCRQLQHHVNGFYLRCGGPFSGLCNEAIRDLQQSAHLHLPYTSTGHAHGVVKR